LSSTIDSLRSSILLNLQSKSLAFYFMGWSPLSFTRRSVKISFKFLSNSNYWSLILSISSNIPFIISSLSNASLLNFFRIFKAVSRLKSSLMIDGSSLKSFTNFYYALISSILSPSPNNLMNSISYSNYSGTFSISYIFSYIYLAFSAEGYSCASNTL
jgi:hypothetical protein